MRGPTPGRCSGRWCIPLSKSGMALGSIFVVTLVMGDFFVVKIMSGGQSASVVLAMSNEIALLQYPPAAASAVVLMLIVMLMVAAILRLVDVRKELSARLPSPWAGRGAAPAVSPHGAQIGACASRHGPTSVPGRFMSWRRSLRCLWCFYMDPCSPSICCHFKGQTAG